MAILTGESINQVRAKVLLSALKLECLGMKKSGPSAYSIAKAEYNLRGSKESVYNQLKSIIGWVYLRGHLRPLSLYFFPYYFKGASVAMDWSSSYPTAVFADCPHILQHRLTHKTQAVDTLHIGTPQKIDSTFILARDPDPLSTLWLITNAYGSGGWHGHRLG